MQLFAYGLPTRFGAHGGAPFPHDQNRYGSTDLDTYMQGHVYMHPHEVRCCRRCYAKSCSV